MSAHTQNRRPAAAPARRSTHAGPDSGAPRSGRRRELVGISIGNALEWFDWSIYSTFAPFFAASFFFPGDPVSAFLASLVVFAVGFVARPIGGFVFGLVGDRLGRKRSMLLSIATISASGLVIALAPTYATIGWAASALLVLARVLQGLAYGGEQPAAQAYLGENAPTARRGLWSSLIYLSGTIGAVLGLVLGAVLSSRLAPEQMGSWGWRVPFAIAAAGGLFALWMRTRMRETEQFLSQVEGGPAEADRTPGLLATIWTHRRSALQVIGLAVGVTVIYYYWVVSTSGFSIAVLGADPTQVLVANVLANVTFLVWLPLWGALSDRIGRRPVMLVGVVGSLAAVHPLSGLVDGDPTHLFAALVVALFFLAAPCAVSPAIMVELFPTRIRTVGVAVPLSLSVAVFGGTTPYVQTWLATHVGGHGFVFYVMALLVITTATVVTLPETRGRALTDRSADYLRAA